MRWRGERGCKISKLIQYIIKYIILIIGLYIKIRYRKFIRNNCKSLNLEEFGKQCLEYIWEMKKEREMRISGLNDKQIEKCKKCIKDKKIAVMYWEDSDTMEFVVESENCDKCEKAEKENGNGI